MKVLETISAAVGKYMAVIVLALALMALLVPATGQWVQTSWIDYLLMAVMFGMGLTLKTDDFKYVFRHPKSMIVGCVGQFTVMPLLAFALGSVFGLDRELLTGVVLVGTCPGGTASNVITYLSGGDVALSVGMTSVNTLLAPVLTPAITYLLLNAYVQVDVWSMVLSIVKVVIVPIALGLIINGFWGRHTRRAAGIMPLVSVIAICLIVMCVVSNFADKILSHGAVVIAVVVLHNLLGYACGYGIGRLLKLDTARIKALSIEIGMQNSGLATNLAKVAFQAQPMAVVPGAIFSVWHNISGALLANWYRRKS